LHHAHLPFELHVFARSPAHVPFDRALEAFEACVTRHAGLDAGATAERLERILVPHPEAAQLYVCGPVPMLETTRRLAVEHGWPEAAVHFEYFENP
ncbi:MAG: oxidoreductase, partial [Actinobacteria bacterium]|nr:oxidoreductase [Actinomycetota bacterium]NIW26313.1 oxidoreductase [Actinomycetota bacterium]